MIGARMPRSTAVRNSKTGLQWVKTTLAKGKRYYYFDTGATDAKGKKVFKPLPDPSDKLRFGEAYSAMLGHRTRREQQGAILTVARMIDLYQRHKKYADLSDGSKRIYTIYLRTLEGEIGNAPAHQVERSDIINLLDKRIDTPGAANSLLRITRALYKWARYQGLVTTNPCTDIELMDIGEHKPWPDDLLAAALVCDDDRIRLGVHLLYYTAQRIGDVLAMRFEAIDADGILDVKQQKTGKELSIPVHRGLRAELDKLGREEGYFILSQAGNQLGQDSLRDPIIEWAAGKGYDVVPHGLRKNAVNALLEVGCSVSETASISGQSLSMVEHYAKRRNQKRLARKAMDQWENGK